MVIEHESNEELSNLLRSDVSDWNNWRSQNPGPVNISGADFTDADLEGANLINANLAGAKLVRAELFMAYLTGANLEGADLNGAQLTTDHMDSVNFAHADLTMANLSGADLRNSKLTGAKLIGANLSGATILNADLSGAELHGADLSFAKLRGAILTDADLYRAVLVGTDLRETDLRKCRVYGASVWDTDLTGAKQTDLIITPREQIMVSVDNLKVAQFIYLLLKNEEVRHVIDSMTAKVVLILGRFTSKRKEILDAIRESLRYRDYTPILFDFDKPISKTTAETISILAGLARFVIADLTDAKSVLQELERVLPKNPSLPIQPLLLTSQKEPGMFDSFEDYPWFLEVYRYQDKKQLLESIEDVIEPADDMASHIRERRKTRQEAKDS